MRAPDFRLHAWLAQLAWRNVCRNWRHTLATMLAITTGFMAISLFDGFLRDLLMNMEDGYTTRGMLGQVIIQKSGASEHLHEDPWAYSLSKDEQESLERFLVKDEAFKRRVRFLGLAGMINAGPNSAIFMGQGYDLAEGVAVRGERWAWDTVAGLPLYRTSEHGIIVGSKLGELLGCSYNKDTPYLHLEGNYIDEERPFHCDNPDVMLSSTTESAQANAIPLHIVGIFDAGFRETNTRAIYMDLKDAQALADTDKISLMSVELLEGADGDAFQSRLHAFVEQSGFGLEIRNWFDHPMASYAKGGMQILGVFRNLFMSIVLLICVMAVGSTMMKSVTERIREIGTLRSFGFLRHQIALIFAWEGCFISLFACCFGLLATLGVGELIEALGLTFKAGVLSAPVLLRIAHAPIAWISSTALLSGLATITSWFCARRASKMRIADALAHA